MANRVTDQAQERVVLARRKPGSPGHEHWGEWRLCDEAAAESLRKFPDEYEVRVAIWESSLERERERVAQMLDERAESELEIARSGKNPTSVEAMYIGRAAAHREVAALLRAQSGGERSESTWVCDDCGLRLPNPTGSAPGYKLPSKVNCPSGHGPMRAVHGDRPSVCPSCGLTRKWMEAHAKGIETELGCSDPWHRPSEEER